MIDYAIILIIVISIAFFIARKGKKKKQKSNDIINVDSENSESQQNPTVTLKSDNVVVNIHSDKFKVYWFEGGKKREGTAMTKNGLQVFDEDGDCILDLTDRLTKYCGVYTIPTTDGSFIDENLKNGEFWFMTVCLTNYLNIKGINGHNFVDFMPEITREGTKVSWKYKEGSESHRPGQTIIYGVY